MKEGLIMLAITLAICLLGCSMDSTTNTPKSYTTIQNNDFKWEYIDEGSGLSFYRARIYGGWLVTKNAWHCPVTFIPLQNPDGWEIKPITSQNKAK